MRSLCSPSLPLRTSSVVPRRPFLHHGTTWDAIPGDWATLPTALRSTFTLCSSPITRTSSSKPSMRSASPCIQSTFSSSRHTHVCHFFISDMVHIYQVSELIAPHLNTLEVVGSWLEYNSVLHSTKPGRTTPFSERLALHSCGSAHTTLQTVVPTTAFSSIRFLQQTATQPLLWSSGGRGRMRRRENLRRCCRTAIETPNHRLCVRCTRRPPIFSPRRTRICSGLRELRGCS